MVRASGELRQGAETGSAGLSQTALDIQVPSRLAPCGWVLRAAGSAGHIKLSVPLRDSACLSLQGFGLV